ncbi:MULTISPECIES: DUF423 domain-containing protein [Rhodopseudomonas]|uniref:Membrane protein n=1 Tax=Rhodopseudomonas palustris TaxID=1076 RepID=A0A0D7EKJ0_RHOPL|nr:MULTISPECIES: DUF423 domain-containing protein [Rhodopseudomonas]KIZ41344.1 membrane protein [Rhodopseudomonas palustris]MDF3809020.1 DUF423 domain-containing protein [Rhodopseudomonas sp. BAL398]WOK16903.1 DUF423 domain-containing protein [Rhodopseudomonas sp. BAL398]
MDRVFRALVVLAGLFGAAGVALAAASAHLPDAARLGSASTMLLFHACAIAAAVLLCERGVTRRIPGLAAAFGFAAGTALFAGDLSLRQFAGHSLFPMAAPTGGTLLIASWLMLAVAALWPRTPRH